MEIHVIDSLNPEDNAMLQALYSRSSDSVTSHMEKVAETGSGKFMEKFYIGYGHRSIADCGSSTVFFENVSLLAAKAIQDNQLYSGQECSTRYLDFQTREVIDPINNNESKAIMNEWLNFYSNSLEILNGHLKEQFPKPDDLDDNTYTKAINARCFDIARGFLPCGITTNLSLHMNLRQMYEHLSALKYHPLMEVNKLANDSWVKLFEKYPHSFKSTFDADQENYLAQSVNLCAYAVGPEEIEEPQINSSIDNETLCRAFTDLLSTRPKGSLIPKASKFFGDIRYEFNLDFGSYRDYQRHRGILTYAPLINGKLGFHQWYINQFPETYHKFINNLINIQFENIRKLAENSNISAEALQYYFPLGTLVRIGSIANLTNLVYWIELRSQKTVHPTLREITHWIGQFLTENYPTLKLYINYDQSDFTFKRGSQDIIEK